MGATVTPCPSTACSRRRCLRAAPGMGRTFNSNKNYKAPIGSKAAGAAFKDTWTLSDVDLAWHGEIADREPRVYAAIEVAGIVHGKAMRSYLTMMAVRLLELRRVLKPTGSLYLHCDAARWSGFATDHQPRVDAASAPKRAPIREARAAPATRPWSRNHRRPTRRPAARCRQEPARAHAHVGERQEERAVLHAGDRDRDHPSRLRCVDILREPRFQTSCRVGSMLSPT